jgi:hypothetical protein
MLNESIMQAARSAITKPKRVQPIWFQLSQSELNECIDRRDKAFEAASKAPEDEIAREALREARQLLRAAVRKAKNKWREEVAERASKKAWRGDPKEAWKATRLIQESFTGHHQQPTQMKMRMPGGKLAETDKQNIQVLHPHFDKIFNGQSLPVNIPEVLEEIPQRIIFHELDEPPTMSELEAQIKRTSNDKAPGESRVTAEALKAASEETKEALLKVLQEFYKGEVDPGEWHEANLTCLFKQKGDAADPSNWRAIALKDMTARIMSAILNARLIKVIQVHGIETQYGSQPKRGCQDGTFVLRSALSTRRYHNLPTWALFVDLVKAFDTVNHELLFQLLARYGVPANLVNAVRRMYNNVRVKLQVGKEKMFVPYTIGVQQGDNMAPVLFVFLMQAFAETLEKKWKTEWNIKVPEYKFFKTTNTERGRLLSQNCKAKGTAFDLFYLLYVDDGAFLFESKEDMARGANEIYDHFERFGLKMHVGRNGKKSKTEAMYFPPSLKKELYHQLDQEEKIPVKDGYITFTRLFKYLGSWVTDTLKDDHEMDTRIKRAKSQIGALKPFFKCPNIKVETKYNIYMAIPVNTALWGCESWSLTEQARKRLSAFHHTSIRYILGINMHNVQEHRIENKMVRKWFWNIPDILHIAQKRQLQWIGKVARMHESRMPRKLLMSWIGHERKPGRPQIMYRNTFAQAIHNAIPTYDPIKGTAKAWMTCAKDEPDWKQTINAWWQTHARPTCSKIPPMPAFDNWTWTGT